MSKKYVVKKKYKGRTKTLTKPTTKRMACMIQDVFPNSYVVEHRPSKAAIGLEVCNRCGTSGLVREDLVGKGNRKCECGGRYVRKGFC